MITLTQQRDTDQLVTEYLDDESLLNMCRAAPSLDMCQDDNFWRQRLINKYGPIPKSIKKKSPNLSWKTFYLKLIYYMKKTKNWNKRMALAAHAGDRDLVIFFIGQGANDWDLGMYGAALGGHSDLIEFFIERGADDWNMGLSYAAGGGHWDIADYFVGKGATN